MQKNGKRQGQPERPRRGEFVRTGGHDRSKRFA
jgi:hypothetical protein